MTKKAPAASAFVFSSQPTRCPVCDLLVPAHTAHACGDLKAEAFPWSAVATVMGRKGGQVKSAAKARAARENGKKGGWATHRASPQGRPVGSRKTKETI